MPKGRISIVEYLNTAPLVWGFTNGPLAGKYDLSFTVPSECAEELRRGAADVAIIPAVEYQRIEDLVVLPGMSVAARGAVRSILVLSRGPIDSAKRFALDTSSRSSAALVRLLCRGRWRISPEFLAARPDPAEMLAEADAALVIGDPALRVALGLDAFARERPDGSHCYTGAPGEFPVRGRVTLFVYDVATEWQAMTGLPCVLAVWAARRSAVTPEMIADFQASKEYGLARISEIAAAASEKLGLPVAGLETYLRDNIDFGLDEENLAGLKLYFQMCEEAGLIPRAAELEFAAQIRARIGARGGD